MAIKKNWVLILTFGIVFCSLLVSAGLSSDVWSWITGKATSGESNYSVTITGSNALTISVDLNSITSNVVPSEESSSDTVFFVNVSDPDGVSDINDSSVNSTIEPPSYGDNRTNVSCVWIEDLNGTTANYTCTMRLWYWDEPGQWNITVQAADLGAGTVISNTTGFFTYQQLKAMVLNNSEISWSSVTPGSPNAAASNDPTWINNTGNYNGTLDINATDLLGESDPTYNLTSGNFTVHAESGSECSGTQMVWHTDTTVPSTNTNPGNLSAGSASGQSMVFYCIPSVPYLSSQVYSTDEQGSWTIKF